MIDWVTCRIPVVLDDPDEDARCFRGGQIISLTPDLSVEWQTVSRLPVEGSHSSRMFVRMLGFDTLEISGNPAKFLQGHNLFGTNSLFDLVRDTVHLVLSRLGLFFRDVNFREADVTVVDVNRMYYLISNEAVLEYLRYLGHVATTRRGRGESFGEGTVYFTPPKSRYWVAKAYSKALEVAKNAPKEQREQLSELAAGTLRMEFRIKSRELEKMNLRRLGDWNDFTADEVFETMLKRVRFPANVTRPASEFEFLPYRLQGVLHGWMAGSDLRQLMPRATWYRARKELLESVGVDILTPCVEPLALTASTTVPHISSFPIWEPPLQAVQRLLN
jgi:II/X family phage/plasmid replication protein